MRAKISIAFITVLYSLTCNAGDKLNRFTKDISISQINIILSENLNIDYSYFNSSEIKENNHGLNSRLNSTFHYVYDFDADKENELVVLVRNTSDIVTLLVMDIVSGSIKNVFKKDFKASNIYGGVFKGEPNKYFIGYSLESSFDYELKFFKGKYTLEYIHDY